MSVHRLLWSCLVLMIGASALRAGIITSPVAFPSGSVSLTTAGSPPANNDNKVGTGSPSYTFNYVVQHITFSTSAAPIDIVFSVGANSGGTREYFFLGTVKNPTGGIPWVGFQLGLSTSSSIPGLDFDWPDRDSLRTYKSALITSALHQATSMTWYSASPAMPGGSNPNLFFSIDVPDAPDSQPYSFTLTMTPLVIPEPASLCGLLLVVGLVRRRPDCRRV